jgi:hypothetical protein
MLRLTLAGIHSLVLSPLCARCPSSRAGCCEAPPAIAWADIGRIVSLGGKDFLLAEVEAGRLRWTTRGLAITRAPANGDFPARCTYLGEAGCVLPPERRSATCNYYVCEDALLLAEGEKDKLAPRARTMNERLADVLGRVDLELSARIDEAFPEGAPFDAAFLDWLAAEAETLFRRARSSVKTLQG